MLVFESLATGDVTFLWVLILVGRVAIISKPHIPLEVQPSLLFLDMLFFRHLFMEKVSINLHNISKK